MGTSILKICFSVAIIILTSNLTGLVLKAFTMEQLFAKF